MNNSRRARILIVEDNNADIILFKEALQAAGIVFELIRFTDGRDCIESLATRVDGPIPDLIILDLNLPRTHGFEVLRAVRANSRLDRVPVAVLTSSRTQDDQQISFDLGANAFITKPTKLDDFLKTVGSSVQALLNVSGTTAVVWISFSPRCRGIRRALEEVACANDSRSQVFPTARRYFHREPLAKRPWSHPEPWRSTGRKTDQTR